MIIVSNTEQQEEQQENYVDGILLFFLHLLLTSSGDSSMGFYNSYKMNFEMDLDDKDFIHSTQLQLRKIFFFFLQLNDTLLENVSRAQKDLVEVYLVTMHANYIGKVKHVYVTREYLTVDYTSRVALLPVRCHTGELELDILI